MDYDGFEVFTGRHGRGRSGGREPCLTITSGGLHLSLNGAAYEQLGRPEHVELLYARGRRQIGVRPASETSATYPVRKQARSETFEIAGRAFTGHYEIPCETAQTLPVELHDGMLVADLARAQPLPPRRRRP